MKKVPIPAVVLVAAFVLAGVAYLIVPVLQDPQAAVDEAAARGVEQARRLLWQFSENEERFAVLLQALDRAGLDTDLPDEQIDRMINSENRELLADEEERLAAITGDPRFADFGRNLPSMASAVREGRRGRDAILAENDKLLADALAAVAQALSVTRGDASSTADPLANRLKAVILYHQGVAAHRKAQRLRHQAETRRRALVQPAQDIERLQADTGLVAGSNIDQRIADARGAGDELRRQRTNKQAEIDKHQAIIDDLSERLEQARATAEQARAVLETLEDRGLNFTDPKGLETFAAEYTAHAETYRRAIREAHELEFGTLKNACLDAGGDYLEDRYVPVGDGPIEIQRGLVAYRHDVEQFNTELRNLDELIEANGKDIAQLNELKERYADQARAAQTRIAELRTEAKSVYAELGRLIGEAQLAEDEAIRKLEQSVGACRMAASEAARRVSDAASITAPAEKLERSPIGLIADDAWVEANIRCQQAGALICASMVHYDRYRDAARDAELLGGIHTVLDLADVDPTALAAKRDRAREAGVKAATEAAELARRAARNLDQHWTVPALVADARYLLVLFGREDLRDNVIENYRAVVDGREDSPFVQAYLNRLDRLERR